VVAFDALHYSQPQAQFRPDLVRREILKCFAAFSRASAITIDDNSMATLPISTGNWGCGAFKGDRELKFVIQLVAAAVTQRSLRYFTFGDTELKDRSERLLNVIKSKAVRVGNLVAMVDEYYSLKNQGDFDGSIFDFLFEVYS
jgi:poly(ADP-ribose) glycohydrolase